MKPLVTALVDTFNHERYIEQALVSVLDQGLSLSELEIVVVDDGSADRTPEIIRKFLPRVKYLRKKNGGQASAFNAAFPEVSGKIVAILDGDDWWAKGKLLAVTDAFERNPQVSAVSHAYYKYDEENDEQEICGPLDVTSLNLSTLEAARLAVSGWKFLQPSALTVRRKVLEQVIPIPEVLVFCADAPIAIASMAMGVLALPKPLSYYRLHGNNLYASASKDMDKLRRRYEMDDVMLSLLWPLLLRLGVPEECASTLLDPFWIWVNRNSLSTFGGSRLKTFRTEMRCFKFHAKNPTLSYRLFKYLLTGSAALLLPPRQFYKLSGWYAKRDLGRLRDLILGTETKPRGGPSAVTKN